MNESIDFDKNKKMREYFDNTPIFHQMGEIDKDILFRKEIDTQITSFLLSVDTLKKSGYNRDCIIKYVSERFPQIASDFIQTFEEMRQNSELEMKQLYPLPQEV